MAEGRGFGAVIGRVTGRLADLPGIVAVVLGGSHARGTADHRSDIDLGLYYEPSAPFDIGALDRIAESVDDGRAGGLVTDFGAWGPGVNGGGWLTIGGTPVDLLYRDLERVRDAITECSAGRPRSFYQLGHPWGFHEQIYMGEIDCCRILVDPLSVIAQLKSRTAEYPAAMCRALIDKHLFDAAFELEIARKPAERADIAYVAASAARVVGFLILVLFAVNRRYFINEKGALAEVSRFEFVPDGFRAAVVETLGQVGNDPAAMNLTLTRLGAIVESVRQFALRHL